MSPFGPDLQNQHHEKATTSNDTRALLRFVRADRHDEAGEVWDQITIWCEARVARKQVSKCESS